MLSLSNGVFLLGEFLVLSFFYLTNFWYYKVVEVNGTLVLIYIRNLF